MGCKKEKRKERREESCERVEVAPKNLEKSEEGSEGCGKKEETLNVHEGCKKPSPPA